VSRQEFRQSVKVAIVKRATDDKGQIRCEQCQGVCRKYEIHHIRMDATEVDKTKPLTAKQGMLLCIPCHKAETKAQMAMLAKAKAQEARHLGVRKPTRKIASAPKPEVERREPAQGMPEIFRRFMVHGVQNEE